MRIGELEKIAQRRKLDRMLVSGQANIRAVTGVNCDNAVLEVVRTPCRGGEKFKTAFHTDFRYVPMVHRVAPELTVRDIRRLGTPAKRRRAAPPRIGYESAVSHARYLAWQKLFPRATFVDVSKDLAALRAVKTPDELD